MQGVSRWSRGLAFGAAALLLCASPSAWAEPGPSIEHQAILSAPAQRPLELHARIVSNSAGTIYKPTVFLRASGVPSFSRIELTSVAGVADMYTATIPASLVTGPFDYYVEASDTEGNGPTRLGSDLAPLHVQVTADVPAAPAKAAAPPPAVAPLVVMQGPPPETSSPTLAFGVIGGSGAAAIAGAVLLGVGHGALSTWTVDSNHLAGAKSLTTAQIGSEHSTANAELTAGACLLGAGVVGLGVGLYLYLSDAPASSTEKKVVLDEAARHPSVAALLVDF